MSVLRRVDERFRLGRFDWEAAGRATVATSVPLFVLLAIGRLDLAIYTSFAAFTALYGRGEPYGRRWLTLLVAGGVMVGSVWAGVGVQLAGAPLWLILVGLALLVALGAGLSSIFQWIPRGALFFVFSFVGCAMRPIGDADPIDPFVAACLVGLFSWIVGMSGLVLRALPGLRGLVRPLTNRPELRLRAAFSRDNAVLVVASVLAGWAAMGIAVGLDVASHHYWAVVTVVAVFTGPAALVSFDRLRMRVVGTLVGVGLAAALFGGSENPLYIVFVLTVCAFLTELVVGTNYGVALAFIMPLAIGATNVGLGSDWEGLFVSRARETLIGGAVCLVVILGLRWLRRRRGHAVPE